MSARLLINFPILEGLRYLLDRAIAQDIHRYQVGVRQLNLFSDNRFLTTIFPFRLPRQDVHLNIRGCLPFHSHQLFHSRKSLNASGTIHDETSTPSKILALTLVIRHPSFLNLLYYI